LETPTPLEDRILAVIVAEKESRMSKSWPNEDRKWFTAIMNTKDLLARFSRRNTTVIAVGSTGGCDRNVRSFVYFCHAGGLFIPFDQVVLYYAESVDPEIIDIQPFTYFNCIPKRSWE